jgi:hypothetical protein
MAGKIIADIIEAPAGRISLNVGNTVVASINASGLYTSTGNLLITQANQIGTAALPTGTVLQVVNATTNSAVSIATTTYTDTGLSASITPTSATSKILVLVSQPYRVGRDSDAEIGAGFQVLRGATVIRDGATDRLDVRGRQTVGAGGTASIGGIATLMVLDSPNTTSSTTYKTQGAPNSTSNFGTLLVQPSSAISSITLLEIAA